MRPLGLTTAGLLTGTVFFAFSLTPSLVPRDHVIQGVLSGLSFGAGYGLGVFGRWLWGYLELPVPGSRTAMRIKLAAGAVCLGTAVLFLWRAAEWQNSVRDIMEMEPVTTAQPITLGIIATLLFTALLAAARLFRYTFRLLSRKLQRFIPRRVSNVVGILLAVFLFWSVIDGVLFAYALRLADASYRQLDALVDDEVEAPVDTLRTGSPASLVEWGDLGRQGRNFVLDTPTAGEIAALSGEEEALEPLRVYVGLNSAPDPEQRARLALEELQRVGAFDRSLLVVVTPTGTGWVDPPAIGAVEYLHGGDVASVAVQYSYLSSPLALLVEGEYGAETSRALFDAVYGHWTGLDPDERPDLYVHGLSLGALNSDLSFDLFDIVADPIQGALWSGPPFRSETWRSVTDRRDPGTPAWLPVFREGSVVRFANQWTGLEAPGAPWGPVRIAFLQHASDPITFFEPQALFRQPGWMEEPRGPDVSPELRWFPVVTMLQLAADMLAGSEPTGYGHEYAAENYVDAWIALTEPEGWGEEEVERLKAVLAYER